MVTEEMLKFIRDERVAGMTDVELTELLLTEGGWDQADVDEAFRALAVTSVTSLSLPRPTTEPFIAPAVPPFAFPPEPLMPPSSPAQTSREVLAIEPDQSSSVQQLTPPASVQPPTPTPAPATLPPSFEGQTLDQTFAEPSPKFSVPLPPPASSLTLVASPQSFSHPPPFGDDHDGADITARPATTPTSVPLPPIFVPSAVPPPPAASITATLAAIKTESASSVDRAPTGLFLGRPLAQRKMAPEQFAGLFSDKAGKMETKWSLSGLIGRDKDKPLSPPSATTGSSQLSTPIVSDFPAGASLIKFDLSSALRQSHFTKAEEPVLPQDHALVTEVSAPYKSPAKPFIDALTGRPEKDLSTHLPTGTSPDRTPLAPNGTPPYEEKEKKKVEFYAKRIMSLDLLRGAQGAPVETPAPATAPTTIKKVLDHALLKAETKIRPAEVSPSTPPIFLDEVTRRQKIKHMLVFAVGALLLLALIGGGIFAFFRFRGEDPEALLSAAFARFFDTLAFAYVGEASADLMLTGLPGSDREDGMIKFSLKYSGKLANSSTGYGDGTHKVAFNGGWQTGTSTFGTSVESDIMIIGDEFYFNILSIPSESELDPVLLRANWIKVNLAEIAREFQLGGTAQGEEEYGSFGGTAGELTLRVLLQKHLPFQGRGSPVREEIDSVSVLRTRIVADPDRLAELFRAFHRRYVNRDLKFTEEELLRFKDALAKLSGDVWTDEETGALIKITVAADLDDDIGVVHVKGPLSLQFSFSGFNEAPLFGTPSPVVSLTELRAQMEESKRLKTLRASDEIRVDRVTLLVESLKAYYEAKGRYPKELSELYGAKKLAESSVDLATLKDYHYRSYIKSGVYSKAGQCSTTGKICAFYHLGTNLFGPDNAALQSDADQTTAILGSDKAGCGGEKDAACYDIVSPAIAITTASAPATTTTVTAPLR